MKENSSLEAAAGDIKEVAQSVNALYDRSKKTSVHELKRIIVNAIRIYQQISISDEDLMATPWPMDGIKASKTVLECVHRYEDALEKAKDCVNADDIGDPQANLQAFSALLVAFKEVHDMDLELDKDVKGINIDLMVPNRMKVSGPVASCLLQKVCDTKYEMFERNEDLPTTLVLQESISQVLEEQVDVINLLNLNLPTTATLPDADAAPHSAMPHGTTPPQPIFGADYQPPSIPMSCIGLLTQLPPNAFPSSPGAPEPADCTFPPGMHSDGSTDWPPAGFLTSPNDQPPNDTIAPPPLQQENGIRNQAVLDDAEDSARGYGDLQVGWNVEGQNVSISELSAAEKSADTGNTDAPSFLPLLKKRTSATRRLKAAGFATQEDDTEEDPKELVAAPQEKVAPLPPDTPVAVAHELFDFTFAGQCGVTAMPPQAEAEDGASAVVPEVPPHALQDQPAELAYANAAPSLQAPPALAVSPPAMAPLTPPRAPPSPDEYTKLINQQHYGQQQSQHGVRSMNGTGAMPHRGQNQELAATSTQARETPSMQAPTPKLRSYQTSADTIDERYLSVVWQEVQAGNTHAVSAFIQQGLISPTMRDAAGHSVLWDALAFGHAKMGLMLLDYFPQWDFTETHARRGDTLLHLLVSGSQFTYHASECFRRIVEHVCHKKDTFTATNATNQTFLHVASSKLNFWVMTYVLTFFYTECLPMIRLGAFLPLRNVLTSPAFRDSAALPSPAPTPFPSYFALAKMLTPCAQTNKPPFADLCIDVGSNTSGTGAQARFLCHAVVVAAQSSVLNQMLDEAQVNAKKTLDDELLIRLDARLSKSVWKCVLQWMYTGVVYVAHLDEPPHAGRKSFELLLACAKYKLADILLTYAVARAEMVRDPEAVAFGLSVHKEFPEVFSKALAETCAYLTLIDNQHEQPDNVAILEALKIMEKRYNKES